MKKSKAHYSSNCCNYSEDKTPEEKDHSFRSHLNSYISVIAFLWVIWFFTGARHMWPVYPMLGWGIGLVCHALATFLNPASRKQQAHNRESEFI